MIRLKLLILLLVFTCLAHVLNEPILIRGDGIEYILQTQSFVFDQSISIDREKRAKYWNENNPFNIKLQVIEDSGTELTEQNQSKGGFGSLYPGRDKKFYYAHSWMYSLIVSPVYKIFNVFGINEYRSFQFVNLIFFCLPFITSSNINIILLLILLASPLSGYVSWTTPELFQFGALASGYSLLQEKKNKFASLLLISLAGAQNFPIIIYLVLIPIFYQVDYGKLLFFLFVSIIPWLNYYLKFGTPNLLVALGQASILYANLERLKSFLFSPVAGLFVFYPFLLFYLKNRKEIILIIVMLVLSYAMTGMANIHSQQIACTRYCCWLIAPLVGVFLINNFNSKKYLIPNLIIFLLLLFNKSYLFPFGTHSRSEYLLPLNSRAQFYYRNTHFMDNPEILTEIATGQELQFPYQFNNFYRIDLGHDQYLCLTPYRAINSHKKNISGCKNDILNWKIDPVLGKYSISYQK